MKKVSLYILLAVLALFVVACGSNNDGENTEESAGDTTVTITHELGETSVKKNPEKIVVFDFGILDSLNELGVEVSGLPKMVIPPYLSKYEDETYENLGSLKEPDFEKIAEIQPELIIISGRQADLYDQFAEIAPTIYMQLDTANYIESFKGNMKTLGEIFEKEAEVDAQLAEIDESIQALNEKASASEVNALIVLANEGKVSAYGPNSRFGLIHDVFGMQPVDESIEDSTHGQSISFEYIVEKDPDYLYVIDRGAAIGEESSAKQVVENELVKNTKAYKEGNIVYLDPSYWYLSGGGFVSVKEMIKEIDESLQ
ncbi:siderophore ABC transporter substrate-binding protein [Pueribacillus sp. YX66]|uniref:siderophore ABC transporter substrate-binding protein n=1 Tax=Pueribacillus sp. YX66 TaxID=3229242 RepID=UPI00358D97A8